MKKNSLSHKDRIGVFVGLFVLAVIVGMLPTDQIHICNGSGILYIVLIIAWSTSVQSRIMHKGIRRLLIFAGVQMGLLFLSRCVRYSLMPEEVRLLEWCWYFYYLFFTGIPLTAFLTALCVGKEEKESASMKHHWLWKPEAVMCLVVLTNGIHGQVFVIDRVSGDYRYNWFYYVIVAWGLFFTFASFTLMMVKCRFSTVRKRWYVPALPAVFFASLMVIYYAKGGSSPQIAGMNLYLLQEVFCLTFITLFEGSIRIGLIPSNRGYDELFRLSHVDAVITDPKGEWVFGSRLYEKERSQDCFWGEENDRMMKQSGRKKGNTGREETGEKEADRDAVRTAGEKSGTEDGKCCVPERTKIEELHGLREVLSQAEIKKQNGAEPGEESEMENLAREKEIFGEGDYRIRKEAISGGFIIWREDMRGIRSLNEKIRLATEQLEEENDLIEQENKIRAEREGYEAKNRLYDRIAQAVHPQVEKIDEIFAKETQGENFRKDLQKAVLLGAYIKRRGNLMLLSRQSDYLPVAELCMSISESFEHLSLSDVFTNLTCEDRNGVIRAELMLLAFDLFEEVLENGWEELNAVAVTLRREEVFDMEIAVSTERLLIPDTWREEECKNYQASIVVRNEDETFYLKFTARCSLS